MTFILISCCILFFVLKCNFEKNTKTATKRVVNELRVIKIIVAVITRQKSGNFS